jgi:hypothetical protein
MICNEISLVNGHYNNVFSFFILAFYHIGIVTLGRDDRALNKLGILLYDTQHYDFQHYELTCTQHNKTKI